MARSGNRDRSVRQGGGWGRDGKIGQVGVGIESCRGGTKGAGAEGMWGGGEILDPQKGKLYKVRMTPTEGGAKLEVRGYVGMPLLGRTQTWIRVE